MGQPESKCESNREGETTDTAAIWGDAVLEEYTKLRGSQKLSAVGESSPNKRSSPHNLSSGEDFKRRKNESSPDLRKNGSLETAPSLQRSSSLAVLSHMNNGTSTFEGNSACIHKLETPSTFGLIKHDVASSPSSDDEDECDRDGQVIDPYEGMGLNSSDAGKTLHHLLDGPILEAASKEATQHSGESRQVPGAPQASSTTPISNPTSELSRLEAALTALYESMDAHQPEKSQVYTHPATCLSPPSGKVNEATNACAAGTTIKLEVENAGSRPDDPARLPGDGVSNDSQLINLQQLESTAHEALSMESLPAPRLLRNSSSASSKEPIRKAWMTSEDQIIVTAVAQIGFRWRCIAQMLPGRSDDAVRNRWNRLQEALREGNDRTEDEGSTSSNAKTGYKCSKCGQPKRNHICTFQPGAEPSTAKRPPALSARVSWTPEEDETIRRNVVSMGPKWAHIAAQLSGRTEHAVRNRWHRLQTHTRPYESGEGSMEDPEDETPSPDLTGQPQPSQPSPHSYRPCAASGFMTQHNFPLSMDTTHVVGEAPAVCAPLVPTLNSMQIGNNVAYESHYGGVLPAMPMTNHNNLMAMTGEHNGYAIPVQQPHMMAHEVQQQMYPPGFSPPMYHPGIYHNMPANY